MDDTKDQLLESYQQLVVLFQEQIAISNKDPYDEQLDEINNLEKKKVNYRIIIDQIRLNTDLYNSIIELHSEVVELHLNQLRQLNATLIQQINKLYSEASKDMKQVTTQRRTLQSYGGVNYSDVISYYFDEKK